MNGQGTNEITAKANRVCIHKDMHKMHLIFKWYKMEKRSLLKHNDMNYFTLE
jgi:hypothetical protein